MDGEKLVRMANQIAVFFSAQARVKGSEEIAVAGIADHIEKFWDPRMRSMLAAHMALGGPTPLDPLARRAVERLLARAVERVRSGDRRAGDALPPAKAPAPIARTATPLATQSAAPVSMAQARPSEAAVPEPSAARPAAGSSAAAPPRTLIIEARPLPPAEPEGVAGVPAEAARGAGAPPAAAPEPAAVPGPVAAAPPGSRAAPPAEASAVVPTAAPEPDERDATRSEPAPTAAAASSVAPPLAPPTGPVATEATAEGVEPLAALAQTGLVIEATAVLVSVGDLPKPAAPPAEAAGETPLPVVQETSDPAPPSSADGPSAGGEARLALDLPEAESASSEETTIVDEAARARLEEEAAAAIAAALDVLLVEASAGEPAGGPDGPFLAEDASPAIEEDVPAAPHSVAGADLPPPAEDLAPPIEDRAPAVDDDLPPIVFDLDFLVAKDVPLALALHEAEVREVAAAAVETAIAPPAVDDASAAMPPPPAPLSPPQPSGAAEAGLDPAAQAVLEALQSLGDGPAALPAPPRPDFVRRDVKVDVSQWDLSLPSDFATGAAEPAKGPPVPVGAEGPEGARTGGKGGEDKPRGLRGLIRWKSKS